MSTSRSTSMSGSGAAPVWSRRRLLALLAGGAVAAPAVGGFLAACGDSRLTRTTTPTDSTGPATTTPVAAIVHPIDPDAQVLRLGYEGGMMPYWMYIPLPSLLISGDGRVFTPGAQIEIYPSPLLSPVVVRQLSETGIQTVLATLRDEGFFVSPSPDYQLADGFGVADASDTVLEFSADGVEYLHRAYALGIDDGVHTTPDRQAFLGLVEALHDLGTLVGMGELGSESVFVPGEYRVVAVEADTADAPVEFPPVVVEWPSGTGVALADFAYPSATAESCAIVPAGPVAEVFAAANALTYFEDDGVTYQIVVAPVLPGDDAC